MSEELSVVKLTEAIRLLSECRTLEETMRIHNIAEAARHYAKMQRLGTEAVNQAAELKIRAERRWGEILREMEKNPGGRPVKTGNGADTSFSQPPTLSDLGISKSQSSRWQAIAEIPEPVFEQHIAETKTAREELTSAGMLRVAAKRRSNLHVSDDTYEWYTPVQHVEAARRVMGEITCDPASSKEANAVIRAKIFFSIEDDGLQQEWCGCVFLNPPYNMPWIGCFVEKAISEYEAGNIQQAIVLTNNSTDTKWFHGLLSRYPVCLTRGRLPFWGADGDTLATRQGQAFFYLGDNVQRFVSEFSEFGIVMARL